MSSRKPLIYLGIFLALAAFYYFYEHKGGIERAEQEELEKKALQFSPDSARGFLIVSRTDTLAGELDSIFLDRTADTWSITKPLSAPADSAEVARLLRSVSDAARNRVVEDSAADLSIFGLDKPQLEFTVNLGDNRFQKLLLGNKNPGGSYIYAVNAEQPRRVVLLNGWLLGDLDRTVFQLRDKTMLDFDRDGVRGITVSQSGDEILRLVRDDNRWRVQQPSEFNAEADSVDEMLEKLADAEAEGFVDTLPDEGAAVYGIDEEALRVELSTESGAMYSLAFGNRNPDGVYYASRGGADGKLMLAGADLVQLLTDDPARLRDMALVSAHRDSISSVSYNGGGENWHAVLDSTGMWTFTEPADMLLDATEMDNYLWSLTDLRATRFIDNPGGKIGVLLATPEFTVGFESGGRSHTIAFAREDSLYYAASGLFAGVAVLDSTAAAALNRGVAAMQDRKLVEFDTGTVDRVIVERPGETPLVLSAGEGEWQVTSPRESEAASWKVQNLLWDLVELEYESELGESRMPAQYGLDSPRVKITVRQGDSTLAVLSLGDPLPDTDPELLAARVEGDNRIYAVAASILAEIPESPGDLTEN